MSGGQQDFVRRIPDSTRQFGRSVNLWQRLHIDPSLLLLLAIIAFYGLVVLYSASGQSEGAMRRQIIFLTLAVVAMVLTAQVDMKMVERWAPWLYVQRHY